MELVDHPRVAEIFVDNNSLQALLDAATWLPTEQQIPLERSNLQHDISRSISSYIKCVQPSSRFEEHLDYIFSHLVGMCDFVLTTDSWVSGKDIMGPAVS